MANLIGLADTLQHKTQTVFDLTFGENVQNQMTQTEVQGAVSRNMELQIVYDKPF